MRREERVKLSDGSLVPVSQGITVPIAEWQALKAKVAEGTLYNTEEIITESGEWEAPVTGWYEVTVIGGGNGGFASTTAISCDAGAAGRRKTALMHLSAGDQVSVVIGSGGIGSTSTRTNLDGGNTSFGSLSTADADSVLYPFNPKSPISDETSYVFRTTGHGPNCASAVWASSTASPRANDAKHFGGGGAASLATRENGAAVNLAIAGNGYQGVVIIRFYDQAKP